VAVKVMSGLHKLKLTQFNVSFVVPLCRNLQLSKASSKSMSISYRGVLFCETMYYHYRFYRSRL